MVSMLCTSRFLVMKCFFCSGVSESGSTPNDSLLLSFTEELVSAIAPTVLYRIPSSVMTMWWAIKVFEGKSPRMYTPKREGLVEKGKPLSMQYTHTHVHTINVQTERWKHQSEIRKESIITRRSWYIYKSYTISMPSKCYYCSFLESVSWVGVVLGLDFLFLELRP